MVINSAVAIGFLPLLVLAVLILAGAAAPWPTLVAMLAIALASIAVALVWTHDVQALADALRHAFESAPVLAAKPLLPPLARLTGEIDRLGRFLTDRTAVRHQHEAENAILECLPDPLIVLRADRTVCRVNSAARHAFGTEIASVLRHPAIRGPIERALSGSTAQTVDVSLPVPVARELQATAIGLDPPLHDGGRILLILSDRTRERAVERMRADFVANASHELRTPLASLIGFIDTLRGPAANDPAAQQRFLGIMAEQGARMHRLIDDLLSLSRIELTEHRVPTTPVDLATLIQKIAAGFEPAFAASGAALDLSIDSRLPAIPGDADQLAQVIQNLLDNALKYGKSTGPVRLTAGSAQPGGPWPPDPGVLLSVADDGPGIPRECIPRLTERFYRVDRGRSRASGGTGLGLAIVKHIVNRHRGRLRIESPEGKGATFSVWLPVSRPVDQPSNSGIGFVRNAKIFDPSGGTMRGWACSPRSGGRRHQQAMSAPTPCPTSRSGRDSVSSRMGLCGSPKKVLLPANKLGLSEFKTSAPQR